MSLKDTKYIDNLKENFNHFEKKFKKEIKKEVINFDWFDTNKKIKNLNLLPDNYLPYYQKISVYKKDLNFFKSLLKSQKKYFNQKYKKIFNWIATTNIEGGVDEFLDYLLKKYTYEQKFLNKVLHNTFQSAEYASSSLFLLRHPKFDVSYREQDAFYLSRQYVGTNEFYEAIFQNKNFNIHIGTSDLVRNCVVVGGFITLIDYILNKYNKETLDLFIEHSVRNGKSDILDYLIEKYNINLLKIDFVSISELLQNDHLNDFIYYLVNNKQYINFLCQHVNKNGNLTPYLMIKLLGYNISIQDPNIFDIIKKNINKKIFTEKLENF